jgi:hypothetical protein
VRRREGEKEREEEVPTKELPALLLYCRPIRRSYIWLAKKKKKNIFTKSQQGDQRRRSKQPDFLD